MSAAAARFSTFFSTYFETFGRKNLLKACASTFANTKIEKVTTQCGTACGDHYIQRKFRVMPNCERNQKEIVTKR